MLRNLSRWRGWVSDILIVAISVLLVSVEWRQGVAIVFQNNRSYFFAHQQYEPFVLINFHLEAWSWIDGVDLNQLASSNSPCQRGSTGPGTYRAYMVASTAVSLLPWENADQGLPLRHLGCPLPLARLGGLARVRHCSGADPRPHLRPPLLTVHNSEQLFYSILIGFLSFFFYNSC